MVVALTGEINGADAIFSYTGDGDVWTATIPTNLSGVYVVALTAVDEAGNMAYMAKYIVTIDTTALQARLVPYPYQSRLIEPSEAVYLPDYRCTLAGRRKRWNYGSTI